MTTTQNTNKVFKNVADGIQAFGLNFRVSLGDLFGGPSLIHMKDKKAVIREDNGQPIGIVGNRYVPIQNADAFAVAEIMAEEKGAMISGGSIFDGGTRVALKILFPDSEKNWVRSESDRVQTGINIINSFDGGTSLYIDPVFTVLICKNGAVRRDVATKGLRIRHVTNADQKIAEGLRLFNLAAGYHDRFIRAARDLDRKLMDKAAVEKFVEHCFPPTMKEDADGFSKIPVVSPQARDARSEVMRLFFEGMGNAGRSAWDAYNGLTEYIDHWKTTDRAKIERSNIFGSTRTLKEDAFEYLQAAR